MERQENIWYNTLMNAECRTQNFGRALPSPLLKVQSFGRTSPSRIIKGVLFLSESIIEKKSFDFAVRCVNLYKHLTEDKKEFILSKQLLRSGTSIGANVSEAEKAQSKADFNAKMNIALKEGNEAYYWLRLLYATEYLTEKEFLSMEKDVDEIISILVAICKKTNQL